MTRNSRNDRNKNNKRNAQEDLAESRKCARARGNRKIISVVIARIHARARGLFNAKREHAKMFPRGGKGRKWRLQIRNAARKNILLSGEEKEEEEAP